MTDRDDWGFSDADHAELQTLMRRHANRLEDAMLAVMADGVKPEPDDPGMMGILGQAAPEESRVFPKGGFWWALLDALRAIDAEKGGA